jgi:hypothetical protein
MIHIPNDVIKYAFSFCLIFSAYSPNNAQCTLKNYGSVNSNYLASTGNVEIDNLVKSEKYKLEQFFNVTVDLKFYSGANGLAKPHCQNSYCNGTIELGKELLSFEYKKMGASTGLTIGKYMIMAIMAHEFAHIYQYSHPEYKFTNSVTQEVHADMLAGWYMTRYFIDNIPESEKYNWEYVSKLRSIYTDMMISFGWMGDDQYWSQQHHGNYYTRSMAFYEGWKDYKERGIKDFSYFLKWSVQTAENLIRDNDQN